MAKKVTPAKKLSFGDAVAEVENILSRLESEEVDIDDLSTEVKRAVELIQVCRDKLEKTDAEVRDLVADLQEPQARGIATDSTDAANSGEDVPF